jgi:hypothetical protein
VWGIECGGGGGGGGGLRWSLGGGGEASAGRKKGAILLSSTRTYQNPVQPEYRYAHTAPPHSKLSPPPSLQAATTRQRGGGSTGVVTTGNNGTAGHNVHETHPSECAHVEPTFRMNGAASAAVPHPLPMPHHHDTALDNILAHGHQN